MDSAMMGIGKADIKDLTRDDLVIPPDFLRALGTK
jgi:isopentenyl diphosphate isomerase/L-lactate dehydrogenase-like FMN-dependent dehydrogenase